MSVVPGKGHRSGLDEPDPRITTGEMRDRFPDFAAGADAVAADPLEAPGHDPAVRAQWEAALVPALEDISGPSRVLRVREAAEVAAWHLAGLQETVDELVDLLADISATVKGKPPEQVPADWWEDLPDRVDDLARQAREHRRRDELADRLGRIEVEKRIEDARREEHARLGRLADVRARAMLAHWVALCSETHGLLADLGVDDPGVEGRAE